MSLSPSLWKVRYGTSHVWAWLGTSFFRTLQPPKSQGRSLEFNRSFVVAEVFKASCNASETRAFIFLNACSTCLKEYPPIDCAGTCAEVPLWLRFTTKNLTGYIFFMVHTPFSFHSIRRTTPVRLP